MSATVGMFSRWQPEYAAHKIATFPVRISSAEKKPAVKNYTRMGLSASAKLVPRFADADAFGFMAGNRSNVTVLDVDSKDEAVLSDALNRHGRTPVIVRSGSGNYQAWYRHNGERRSIKPWRGLPIDLLGGGYVVAPPSISTKGQYQFIEGSLDDLHQLPVLRNVDVVKPVKWAKEGERNKRLWEHCMRNAHHVDSLDVLLDVARTFNDNCEPPMEDSEVISAAQSAWSYTERGENRFGQHGAWFPLDEVRKFLSENEDAKKSLDQDAALLLMFMRAHQGPDATFMCANGLAEKLGWNRKRFGGARARLIELGHFKPVRQAGRGHPALFRWQRKGGQN
jgi:Bifunctional DNA primase/polymerase, N-terminal/Primase C terminal 1 (PriCT-1)